MYLLLPEWTVTFPGRRRQNLALVFWVHLMLLYILLPMHVCFCCVCFSFLLLRRDWEECLSEMTLFVLGGT